MKRAVQSFPSGHSSFSTSGMLYLSLWFLKAVPLAKFKNEPPESWTSPGASTGSLSLRSAKSSRLGFRVHSKRFAVSFVPLLPLMLAAVVCASRIIDYWHNYEDVMMGATVGVGSAWFATWYVREFPLVPHLPRAGSDTCGSSLLASSRFDDQPFDSSVL